MNEVSENSNFFCLKRKFYRKNITNQSRKLSNNFFDPNQKRKIQRKDIKILNFLEDCDEIQKKKKNCLHSQSRAKFMKQFKKPSKIGHGQETLISHFA